MVLSYMNEKKNCVKKCFETLSSFNKSRENDWNQERCQKDNNPTKHWKKIS